MFNEKITFSQKIAKISDKVRRREKENAIKKYNRSIKNH
jgi:hypothetical protein